MRKPFIHTSMQLEYCTFLSISSPVPDVSCVVCRTRSSRWTASCLQSCICKHPRPPQGLALLQSLPQQRTLPPSPTALPPWPPHQFDPPSPRQLASRIYPSSFPTSTNNHRALGCRKPLQSQAPSPAAASQWAASSVPFHGSQTLMCLGMRSSPACTGVSLLQTSLTQPSALCAGESLPTSAPAQGSRGTAELVWGA